MVQVMKNRKVSNSEDWVGHRFGRLVITAFKDRTTGGKSQWMCLCDCGTECVSRLDTLRQGKKKSCGCLQPGASVGNKYGRLLVTSLKETVDGRATWNCLCDCGKICTAIGSQLTTGKKKSCGCLKQVIQRDDEGKRKRSPEYLSYMAMKARCYNPSDKDYMHCGAKGIKVCTQWLRGFQFFLMDMGYKPNPDMVLVRKDTKADFSSLNCLWVPPNHYLANKSRVKLITHRNKSLPLIEWARIHGIRPGTLKDRMRRGWTFERAVTTPTQPVAIPVPLAEVLASAD